MPTKIPGLLSRELGGPAVDERLLGKADPRHGQRVARHREHQRAPEAARLADDEARGVEQDVAELEAVAALGKGEGIAVGHLPAAHVALCIAGLQVHGGGGARIGRAAGGEDEGEQAHPGSHCVTLSVARMCALVESAYRIAATTPRAPGIREPARMLSRCRWVRLSPGAADDRSGLPPPQAARSRRSRMADEVRMMSPVSAADNM